MKIVALWTYLVRLEPGRHPRVLLERAAAVVIRRRVALRRVVVRRRRRRRVRRDALSRDAAELPRLLTHVNVVAFPRTLAVPTNLSANTQTRRD